MEESTSHTQQSSSASGAGTNLSYCYSLQTFFCSVCVDAPNLFVFQLESTIHTKGYIG